MADSKIDRKIAEAAEALAEAKRELERALTELGEPTDNVMISDEVKKGFAKLHTLRTKLAALETQR